MLRAAQRARPLRWMLTAAALMVLPFQPASAQTTGDTITLAAGAHYANSGFSRWLLGSGWRDLWTVPVRVPVLDITGFRGGLTPERQGGGKQSITLHMVDASGDSWIFRSIDKFPVQALGPEIDGTPIGSLVQDQVSILHPGGHLVMPRLLGAAGILHVDPVLVVMPDHAALGEFRDVFAGMLGEFEQQPNEGPDDTPGFADSRKVKGTEDFLDDIEDSAEHRLDEHEFLRARLIDFVAGDPDRGSDQWRWARFGAPGAYRWRVVPRDRDWAFVRADGVAMRVAAKIYPKLDRFDSDFSSIETLTYSSHLLDRRLLTRLTRRDFAVEADRVERSLTDDVIAEAVAGMPPEYVASHGEMMAVHMRARRDRLQQIAAEFYSLLATEVDIRATDNADVAVIERRADGTVLVTIRSHVPARDVAADAGTDATAADAAAGRGNGSADRVVLFYERVFEPSETNEVRVFLHGGVDTVRVTGAADGPIRLRVVGGGGDDTLIDEAGNARFYDDRGDNRIVRSRGTGFSAVPWQTPLAPEGLRAGSDWSPDYGGSSGFGPAADYEEVAGVIVGARASMLRYGFRRLPYRWRLDGRVMAAPAISGYGAEAELDFRPENSRHRLSLLAGASQLDAFRFHGFGNQSVARGSGQSLFRYDAVRIDPAIEWSLGRLPGRPVDDDAGDDDEGDEDEDDTDVVFAGTFRFGPVFGWTRARLPDALAGDDVVTDASVTQLGARAVLDVQRTDRPRTPRRGFSFSAEVAGYPATSGGATGPFGRAGGQAIGYVPLGPEPWPHVAVRVAGERVVGEFPTWEAAFLGGRHSLRGVGRGRFAGDAAVNGTLELRVPIDTVRTLLRTELGVFGFGDVGRVWYNGDSPGGWHTGWGGGLWIGAFGRAMSAAVARSERTRLHVWLGMPF